MDTSRLLLLVLYTLTTLWKGGFGGNRLSDRLAYYQTLHKDDLEHNIVKRSAESPYPAERQVSLTVMGRHLQLNLKTVTRLFSEDFTLLTEGKDLKQKKVDFDLNQFYEGYVTGEESDSDVHAYFDDGNLNAEITLSKGTIMVEPSHPHLPLSDKYTMISYWVSDIKQEEQDHPHQHLGPSFCGYVHPDYDEANYTVVQSDKYHQATHTYTSAHHRTKRAARIPDKNRCSLMLVADYTFFKGTGQGSIPKTAAYLIELIDRIDKIYRTSEFGDLTGMGFEIKGVLIHNNYNNETGHYNSYNTAWDTKELLKAFSRNNWGPYCLAHLFTEQAFSKGVLGLGWIAKDTPGTAGGICSPNSGGTYYNTAWSSSLNKYGTPILAQEAKIVTSHELGHNWGSPHDPESTECSPSSKDGGKFIMYTYSVSGYDRNNELFSPCSRTTMGAVLVAKSTACFTEPTNQFCGNLRVEEGEECDSGGVEDACCTLRCTLKSGAQCSDVNDECCDNCQLLPQGTVCSQQSGNILLCKGNATCDGTSKVCPEPGNRADGDPCFDNGQCFNGECQPFCESQNSSLVTCACDTLENSCKVCCKSPSGTCSPVTGLTLADGKPCLSGTCLQGKCQVEVVDLTDKLWDVITNISVDGVLEWMRTNIVITVIFLSLILFVPICIIIACIDHRREKEEEDEMEWYHAENRTLVRNEETRTIHKAFLPHKRMSGQSQGGRRPESNWSPPSYDDLQSPPRERKHRGGPVKHITVSENVERY